MLNPMATVRRAELVIRRNATLGTIMASLAEIHGDRPLMAERDGLALTYTEAADLVDRWAAAVAARTEPGDRVVVATPNGYQQLLLCLAVSRAGALPVPVNSQMRAEEISHVKADCGAAFTITDRADVDGHEPLGKAYPSSPGELGALFYTSGTTGKPKGAELTHRALVGQFLVAALYPGGLRHEEAVLSLPVAHIMGFIVLVGLACAGVPVYFIGHFRPTDILDAIEERQSTSFVGVPAMYRLLLEAGAEQRDLRSVRIWGVGADAMPTELAQRFKKLGSTAKLPVVGHVGEAMVLEGYGMVETGGGAVAKVSPPFLNVGLGGDAFGVALPGYKLRVVDDDEREVRPGQVGELWLKGPGVLRGYWRAPDATKAAVTEDGWLRTGDLARRGFGPTVRFVGRNKDVIKHGGYSVYALEVQTTLEEHPDVLEAAVLGLPDERLGEVPVAAVRLSPGVALDDADLGAWAADHLADYKVPKRFIALDELPRTGTKKVQKAELRPLF